jgi:hypothetical protein
VQQRGRESSQLHALQFRIETELGARRLDPFIEIGLE